jgi:hypothetical protein
MLAELENLLTMHGGINSQSELRSVLNRDWGASYLPGPNNKTKWNTSYQTLTGAKTAFVTDLDITAMKYEFDNFGLKGKRVEDFFNSLPVMKKFCTKVSIDSYVDSGKPNQTGDWRTIFISYSESLAGILR